MAIRDAWFEEVKGAPVGNKCESRGGGGKYVGGGRRQSNMSQGVCGGGAHDFCVGTEVGRTLGEGGT